MLSKNQWVALVLVLGAVVMLSSCAGPNGFVDTPRVNGSAAGFWSGLWHGLTAFIMFIISLFSDNLHFYEVHNNGGWYDFGFILGTGVFGRGVAVLF